MNREKNEVEECSGEDSDVPLSRFKCSLKQWNDWNWQLKNRIQTVEKLIEVFPEIKISDLGLEEVASK